MIPMHTKTPNAVAEVFDFMHKRKLTLTGLIEVGGEDLASSNPLLSEKVNSAEKTWSLMARLNVKYADLEQAASPTEPARRRRGRKPKPEVLENKEVSPIELAEVNVLKTNNKTDDAPVDARKCRTRALETQAASDSRSGVMSRLPEYLNPPAIKISVQRLACFDCGAETNATCNCGVAYLPKSVQAAEAIAVDPAKSKSAARRRDRRG